MSVAEERKLLSKMTSLDEIGHIYDMGVRQELFEEPMCRIAFGFMVDYWLDAQMRHAPTWVVMETEFPNLQLPDHVEETSGWLIERLRNRYAVNRLQEVVRGTLTPASQEDPVGALATLWQSAYESAQTVAPRYTRSDVTDNVDARRDRYFRNANERATSGVPIGLTDLDEHTRGILPGELAAVAAYTKTGKSWLLAQAFVHALRSGLKPIFFSLEMGIPEIEDRIDAIYSGVSYQRFSQHTLTPQEIVTLQRAQDEMREMDNQGFIERPQRGERTVKHMVSRARQAGADVLLIDQLSFIDAERHYTGDSALRMKHGDLVFELKDEIARESVGKIPCLMAVQLNRQAASGAGGRGELYHFANSSMVEQTVDLALGLWRTQEMRANNAMGIDIIGSRRCDTRSWTLAWHLTERTEISVREEFIDNQGV